MPPFPSDAIPTPVACLTGLAAERHAGRYAVCLRFRNGQLLRIGGVYARAADALNELRSGRHAHYHLCGGQTLVVGTCSRPRRSWLELPSRSRRARDGNPHATPLAQDKAAG